MREEVGNGSNAEGDAQSNRSGGPLFLRPFSRLLHLGVRCLGQLFYGGEAPVPLGSEVGHRPSGPVETVRFYG